MNRWFGRIQIRDAKPVVETTDSTMTTSDRNDRTRRLLARLLGERSADMALTHFRGARVRLSASPATLSTPNGMLAFATAANMLTRFVGDLVLVTGALEDREVSELERLLEGLRRVDSTPGKKLAIEIGAPKAHDGHRLHIGESETLKVRGEGTLFVSFDAWQAAIHRSCPLGPITASRVPFGGLIAACLAVAEVFKTLVCEAVPSESMQRKFSARLVQSYRYSAWYADRVDVFSRNELADPPDDLPRIELNGFLQVGAGAVGNATALAIRSAPGLCGQLPLLDPKEVDAKSLNRCLFFTELDVGESKAQIVAARASRALLQIRGEQRTFVSSDGERTRVLISTVDNNDVRHMMQESLPRWIVQGSTSATSVAVSVHSATDGRSCLICRHPDRQHGVTRVVPLSITQAAAKLGVSEDVIQQNRFANTAEISNDFIQTLTGLDPDVVSFFENARSLGHDLCGAIGDFRSRFGIPNGPQEPSIPFASAFAGFQAAAEVVKLGLVEAGVENVPVLENVLEIDLGFDYARHRTPAFREPPRTDCSLCQVRRREVSVLYSKKWSGD